MVWRGGTSLGDAWKACTLALPWRSLRLHVPPSRCVFVQSREAKAAQPQRYIDSRPGFHSVFCAITQLNEESRHFGIRYHTELHSHRRLPRPRSWPFHRRRRSIVRQGHRHHLNTLPFLLSSSSPSRTRPFQSPYYWLFSLLLTPALSTPFDASISLNCPDCSASQEPRLSKASSKRVANYLGTLALVQLHAYMVFLRRYSLSLLETYTNMQEIL